MSIVDSLLQDNAEDFRKEIHAALYDKIKEKLQNKKLEIASTLYDDQPCEDCDKQEASE
jgi:hypothetical protein